MPDNQDPICPKCHGTTGWDLQDPYTLGGHHVVQRLQVCHNSCGWQGHLVLFPLPAATKALKLFTRCAEAFQGSWGKRT